MSKKLNNLFQNSPKISINDASKIVIMSDCHRGSGDSFDNFLKKLFNVSTAAIASITSAVGCA